MNRSTVRIPTPLRKFTAGADEVAAAGATVREVLANLAERHGELRDKILNEEGELRSFVNVFVGETNVRSSQGLATAVHEGDVLSILPAVAGGGR
jgi:MoaD family protein